MFNNLNRNKPSSCLKSGIRIRIERARVCRSTGQLENVRIGFEVPQGSRLGLLFLPFLAVLQRDTKLDAVAQAKTRRIRKLLSC